MTQQTHNKKATVAILFFSVGFLVFVSLVISGKIVDKEVYVGKQALEMYQGGNELAKIIFYARVAAELAVHDAFVEQARHGGLYDAGQCMKNGYTVWFSDDCEFTIDEINNNFILYFNETFQQHIDAVATMSDIKVSYPKHYDYSLRDRKMQITSKDSITYYDYNNTYKAPFSLPPQDLDDSNLVLYSIVLEQVQRASSCLLTEHGKEKNYGSCFESKNLTSQITFDSDYFFFTMHPVSGEKWFKDTTLRFAITLNRLGDLVLPNTEHISF